MNFYMSLIFATVAWLTFSVLNELASANNAGGGCCEKNDCGDGPVASLMWWSNLAVALVFTIYFLIQIYVQFYGGSTSRVAQYASLI